MKKMLGIAFLTISIIGISALSVYFDIRSLKYFNAKRIEISRNYLFKGKNEQDESRKLLYYEQATLLNPTVENRILTGITALNLGKADLASFYLSGIQKAPGLLNLGRAYYKTERYAEARAAYERSNDLSKSEDATVGTIETDLKMGNIELATTDLNRLAPRYPDNQVLGVYWLLLVDNSRPIQNEELRYSRIRTENDSANRVALVFNELESLGFPQAAQNYLVENGQNGRLTRDGFIELGNGYFKLGDYSNAIAAYLKAKDIDPYYPQVYTHLSDTAQKVGNTSEANQFLEKYKQLTW